MSREKNRGITVIALIVTIIILLILAGVVLASLEGENGILNKASVSKKETTWGGEEEEIKIAYNGAAMDKFGLGSVTAEDLNKQFRANATNATAENDADGNIKVKFNETLNQYLVDKKGNITLLEEKDDSTGDDTDDTIVSMTKSELKNLIKDEVNSQLSSGEITEESSIVLNDSSNWDIKFNKVIKTGKQCTILFGGTYKNNFNSTSTNIGNLPYTPKCMITDSGAVSTVDINQLHDVLSVKLDTNGSINVADWGTTGGKTIVINTTYICQ